MQALFGACAVAAKRLRRFAHAQNDLIWTAADATKLDLAAAPNGGSARATQYEGQSRSVSRSSAPRDPIADYLRLFRCGRRGGAGYRSSSQLRILGFR
jgi:hypothetical protein